MTVFSDLPAELIIKILFYLDVVSIVSVRLTSSIFNDIFTDSVSLRYKHLLEVSGFLDRSSVVRVPDVDDQQKVSSLSSTENSLKTKIFTIAEKYSLLQAHESAWSTLDLKRKIPLDVVHHPSNIYDLTAGVYVLGDAQDDIITRSTRSLRYVDLGARVRAAEQSLKEGGFRRKRANLSRVDWPKIDIGVDIIDIGFALHEHDLVACLSRQWTEAPPWQVNVSELNHLHLIQFSTGRPHPLAACPIIPVDEYPLDFHRVSVMIEIVGPLLLLLVTRPYAEDAPDKLFLFDWMRGEMLVREVSARNSFYGFVFLTPEMAVLPNIKKGVLEIIHLPFSDSSTHPNSQSTDSDAQQHNSSNNSNTTNAENVKSRFERLCWFELPELAHMHSYSIISCRADPNPFGYPHTYKDTPTEGSATDKFCLPYRGYRQPFTSDPYEAIALFQCYVSDNRARFAPAQWARRPACFSFVIRRNKLIELANDGSSYAIPIKCVTEGIPVIPWNAWGPQNTRWCSPTARTARGIDLENENEDEDDEDDEGEGTRWITITAGQREVLLRRGRIVVRDYNPWTVRKARAAERKREREEERRDMDVVEDELLAMYRTNFQVPQKKGRRGSESSRIRIIDKPSYTHSRGYFASSIESSVPYVEIISEEKYRYDGVLMDEERIIGLTTDNDTGAVNHMDVFALSPDPLNEGV